jgi:hypothetical protein
VSSIVVSKLDRLSRDLAFVSGLMAQRVPFIVAELGRDADPFMLHLYAALAEKRTATDIGANNSGAAGEESERAKLGNPTSLYVASSIAICGPSRCPFYFLRARRARCSSLGHLDRA